MTALLNHNQPAGTAVEPGHPDPMLLTDRERALVLVVRSTAYGTAAAARRLAAWQGPPPWLVLVADVPAPEPHPVLFRVGALSSQVQGVARVPFLFPLRAVERAEDALEARSVTAAASKLVRTLKG